MLSLLSYRIKRLRRGVLSRIALIYPRVGQIMATPAPLARMEYRGHTRSKTVMVFLPGISDLAEDFDRQGFIKEMRRQDIPMDAIALDTHYGYYATEALFERITDDVVKLAHSAGYEKIWLAGISLGGFGAASYAARHANQITGVMLFSPYLGNRALIREIAAAGGLSRWCPGDVDEGDHQRALWTWFKHCLADDGPTMKIYLGYGTSDVFARANAMLANALPKDHVFTITGRHN